MEKRGPKARQRQRIEAKYGCDLGTLLREAYKKRPDISQAQLAKHFGVSQSTVNRWLVEEQLEPVLTTVLRPRQKEAGREYPNVRSA